MKALSKLFQHLPSSYELFLQFTHDVLSCCQQASQNIDSRYVYRDKSAGTAVYDDQYVKAKFACEMANFSYDSPLLQTKLAQVPLDLTVDFSPSMKSSSHSPSPPLQSTDPTKSTLDPTVLSKTTDTPPFNILPSNSSRTSPPSRLPTPRCHSCAECKKTYTGGDAISNLRRHRREFHEGKKTLRCPFEGCPLVSPRKDNLRRHWLHRHRGVEMPRWLVKGKARRGLAGLVTVGEATACRSIEANSRGNSF